MNAYALWGSNARRIGGDIEATLTLSGEFAAIEGPGESWSAPLPQFCDARNLAHVLELVAAGAFGEVEAVKGAMRTRAHWVAFEITGRRARMAPFAPQTLQEPLIVATGRRFDRVRLRAALESCAA